MPLFIAEKPALARAIAEALDGHCVRRKGYLECGVARVTWCVGHLLELAEPDAYDPAWARWALEPLPLVPRQWKLRARKGAAEQLRVVRELLKDAEQIIHAGDPDREGQLLVDELFTHLRLSRARRDQVQRLLINDLNPGAIRKALARQQLNSAFYNLSQSALARSHADWLYGINMTRAWTLLGQQQGYNGVLSVGRVQTPLLGLVVRRDREIAEFVPRAFFQLDAEVCTADKELFRVRWEPSESCRKWQDDEGRVLHRPLCEHVAARIMGQRGVVEQLKQAHKAEPAPLPFSLSALQVAAGKRYRFSAAKVLELAQSLYERHQLITYPRSDCRYLPRDHGAEGRAVGQAVAACSPELAQAVAGADWSLRSRAFDDRKVTAHHALIPTSRCVQPGRLSADEQRLYQLIARQYLAQFYPEYRYSRTDVAVRIEGGLFRTRARSPLQPGWRQLFKAPSGAAGEEAEPLLPPLVEGQTVDCVATHIQDKATTPPEAFTDASLIAAMTGIARFVEDPEIRRVLRETDGLGTEATRASIIETLLKRQLLYREGRAIHATDAGGQLIAALPEPVTRADMTARWEAALERIAEGGEQYDGFMARLEQELGGLIEQARHDGSASLAGLRGQGAGSARCGRGRKRAGSSGNRGTRPSRKAVHAGTQDQGLCRACGKPMVRRQGPRGAFLGCSGYPGCRATLPLDGVEKAR